MPLTPAQENRFARQFARTGDRQTREILSLLDQSRKELIRRLNETATEWTQFFVPQLLETLGEATDDIRREWLRRNAAQVEQAWGAGIRRFEAAAVGVDGFKMLPTVSRDTLDVLKAYNASLIASVTEDMRAGITRQLQVGVLTGESASKTAKRFAEVLPSAKKHGTIGKRAQAIARTEFGRIANTAHDERFVDLAQVRDELGFSKPRKKWIHNAGIGQRDNHAAMHGQIADEDGFFKVFGTGYTCRYPHDPSLPAAESVNCRCAVVTVFPEVEGAL